MGGRKADRCHIAGDAGDGFARVLVRRAGHGFAMVVARGVGGGFAKPAIRKRGDGFGKEGWACGARLSRNAGVGY